MREDNDDPQAALDWPRFMIDAEGGSGQVMLEEGMPIETMAALESMGHPIRVVSGYERAVFGRGQIIRRDRESGVLCAGSDPRADGLAMSLIP
jgi:gamma-glutamyltranspeptidase / glutathione hydrolase